jgi:hypothetical protein
VCPTPREADRPRKRPVVRRLPKRPGRGPAPRGLPRSRGLSLQYRPTLSGWIASGFPGCPTRAEVAGRKPVHQPSAAETPPFRAGEERRPGMLINLNACCLPEPILGDSAVPEQQLKKALREQPLRLGLKPRKGLRLNKPGTAPSRVPLPQGQGWRPASAGTICSRRLRGPDRLEPEQESSVGLLHECQACRERSCAEQTRSRGIGPKIGMTSP